MLLTSKIGVTTIDDSHTTANERKLVSQEEVERLQIKVREIEKELEEKKAELAIICDLDEIRDEFADPRSMFERIVELLSNRFHALFCLLYIVDDESGVLDLWGGNAARKEVLSEVNQHIKAERLFKWLDEHYDSLSRTKEEAVIMIMKNKTPPAEFQIQVAQPVHLLCVQIVMDKKKIGILLLGRETLFSALEIATLKAANSQVDSAIVQAHNVCNLNKMNYVHICLRCFPISLLICNFVTKNLKSFTL
jgi:hypothetical protein